MCDHDAALGYGAWGTRYAGDAAVAAAAVLPLAWAGYVAERRGRWPDAAAMAIQAFTFALRPPLGLRVTIFMVYASVVCASRVTLTPWVPLAGPGITLVAAFFAELPCTAVWLRVVDALAWAGVAWRWVARRRRRAIALACYGEAAAVYVFFFYEGQLRSKESHLTWWGLTGLGLWAVVHGIDACWGTQGLRKALSPPLGAMQIAIALGTVGLSGFRCKLLSNAFADNGAAVYASGNFLMHYYPIARRAASAPRRHCTAAWVAQTSVGAFIVCAYASSVDPATVYSCNALSPGSAAVLTATLGFLGMAVTVAATYAVDALEKRGASPSVSFK